MITGALKNKIDRVWDAFWSGGISGPLEVIEQITYLLFMLGDIPMEDRDTNGDLYEYLLSKIATSGTNGQFRTPRHIIKLMVEMMEPKPGDEICDPACGTAGFLVAAAEHIRARHEKALYDETQRKHFHRSMFHGHDFDSTMLRRRRRWAGWSRGRSDAQVIGGGMARSVRSGGVRGCRSFV